VAATGASESGARIEVGNSATLPHSFELFFPLRQTTLQAHVRWRGEREIAFHARAQLGDFCPQLRVLGLELQHPLGQLGLHGIGGSGVGVLEDEAEPSIAYGPAWRGAGYSLQRVRSRRIDPA
jgi:hypothetical protein